MEGFCCDKAALLAKGSSVFAGTADQAAHPSSAGGAAEVDGASSSCMLVKSMVAEVEAAC